MRRRYTNYNDFQYTPAYAVMKSKLNDAFRLLRKAGFVAKQNWKCCQSCGCAALPEKALKYIFYHHQGTDNLKERGSVYMTWGSSEDLSEEKYTEMANEAIQIFNRVGLVTEWEGSSATRILVKSASVK